METAEAFAQARQILTDFIVRHEQRQTPERFALLEAIYTKFEDRFTADQLYEYLATEAHYRLSKSTVYNHLNILWEAQLVQRCLIGNTVLYDRVIGKVPVEIMECTDCGCVRCRTMERVLEVLKEERRFHFHTQYYTVHVYGLCQKCYARKQRQQTKVNKRNNNKPDTK